MYEWAQWLLYTSGLPICAFLIFKPKLNNFFKLLLATMIASLLSECLGYVGRVYYQNNLYVYQTYVLVNTLLVAFMWSAQHSYSTLEKKIAKYFGLFIFTIVLILTPIFSISAELIYISIVLGLFLNFVLALQYFYHLLLNPSKSSLIENPYVITASAYIFIGLALAVIMISLELVEKDSRKDLLSMRQVFMCIHYIIISYAFYVLSKKTEFK